MIEKSRGFHPSQPGNPIVFSPKCIYLIYLSLENPTIFSCETCPTSCSPPPQTQEKSHVRSTQLSTLKIIVQGQSECGVGSGAGRWLCLTICFWRVARRSGGESFPQSRWRVFRWRVVWWCGGVVFFLVRPWEVMVRLSFFCWVGGWVVPVLVYWFLLIGIGAVWFFCCEKCCVDVIGFRQFRFFFCNSCLLCNSCVSMFSSGNSTFVI